MTESTESTESTDRAFRVCLVNMPFAALENPSLALTQLRSVLIDRLGDRVSVEILYLNQEIARGIGFDLYQRVADCEQTRNCGLGDWIFRQLAFPDAPDNSDEYLGRYIPGHDAHAIALKRDVCEFRIRLERLLDEAIDTHALDQARLVGFTSMFFQQTASLAMARRIKARNHEVVTVLGGATCETPMGEQIASHVEHVDFVFSGPALINFPELVERLAVGDPQPGRQIAGVFASGANAAAGSRRSIGEELPIDQPIQLDYSDFLDALDRNFPGRNLQPQLMFETSRGCWWGERAHCTFCGLNGQTMAHRTMPAGIAIRQFEELFRYYPRSRNFSAVDNLLPREYVEEVFPKIEPPPGATLFYEVKASLSTEQLEVLARARVYRLQPGIESLATTTLKLMRKGTTAFHNLRFLKNCLRFGIEPTWNLLIGFPGEREDVYRKYVSDLPLLTHLFPPSGAWPVRFDRYSPYFMDADSYGLDLKPMDFYALVYPFPPDALADLAYYFSDQNFDADYLAALVPWIQPIREPIDAWQRRWANGIATAPRLCLSDDDPNVVIDTRSGCRVEHPLGEHGAAVLHFLEDAAGLAGLASGLGDRPGFDAEREVDALTRRGMLFHEHKRFLSLVVTPARSEPALASAKPALLRVARDAHRVATSAGRPEPRHGTPVP